MSKSVCFKCGPGFGCRLFGVGIGYDIVLGYVAFKLFRSALFIRCIHMFHPFLLIFNIRYILIQKRFYNIEY